MPRIRVVGYIDPVSADIDPSELDDRSPTGLTEQGYLNLVADEDGSGLKLVDLEDLTVEVQML